MKLLTQRDNYVQMTYTNQGCITNTSTTAPVQRYNTHNKLQSLLYEEYSKILPKLKASEMAHHIPVYSIPIHSQMIPTLTYLLIHFKKNNNNKPRAV